MLFFFLHLIEDLNILFCHSTMTKFESCILNNNTVNIICKCIQNVQFRNLTASRSAYVNNIKVVQRTELF